MTKISAEIRGIPQLKKKLTFLELKAFPRAMSKALNRTATTVRAEQARAIKESMGLSRVGDVKKRISIRKARPNRLVARLEYKGRPLNLIAFKARQLKAGVRHQAWGNKRTIAGAFIVEASNGKRLVFIRKGGRGKRGRGVNPASRRAAAIAMAIGKPDRGGKLKALSGPGIADTAATPAIQDIREKTVARVLTERFESNLRFEVDKLRRRRSR